jgi:L-rhamnose mutarotase
VTRQMCFLLDLVDDAALIREYCRMHEPGAVWPAVINYIRAQGVETMEIWQHADRLFMIIKASDDYPRRATSQAAQQEADRWETVMAGFQQRLPDTPPGQKWVSMRRIFALADHEGRSKP